jgi:hypothetical protein
MPFSNFTDANFIHAMWTFTGGAILVLLQSIISGVKRNWWSLLIGCALGGAGSWVAGQIWGDSKYVFIICGVAAVITENLMAGVVNASREFAESPIKVATHLGRTFLPSFGRSTGDTSESIDTKDLK